MGHGTKNSHLNEIRDTEDMMTENFYAPPGGDVSGPPMGRRSVGNGVSDSILQSLTKTKPWVYLLGVFGILLALLFCVLAVIFLVGGAAMLSDVEEFSGLGALGGVFAAGLYLFIAFLYGVPSIFLFQYGRSIGQLQYDPTVANLEKAIANQSKFWRFVGIMMLVTIVIYFGIIVIAILVAAVGS